MESGQLSSLRMRGFFLLPRMEKKALRWEEHIWGCVRQRKNKRASGLGRYVWMSRPWPTQSLIPIYGALVYG